MAAIEVAQENQNVFVASGRAQHGSAVMFTFRKAGWRVTCFYFELWDLCDGLGPDQIQAFFDAGPICCRCPWTYRTGRQSTGGSCRCRQIETSRTMVFDQPGRTRAFFSALVADNLDVGPRDHVDLILAGHPRRWGRPPKIEPVCKDPDRYPQTPLA